MRHLWSGRLLPFHYDRRGQAAVLPPLCFVILAAIALPLLGACSKTGNKTALMAEAQEAQRADDLKAALIKESEGAERAGNLDKAIEKLKQVGLIETDEGERLKIQEQIKVLTTKKSRREWDDARRKAIEGVDRYEAERRLRWLDRAERYYTLYTDGQEMLDRQEFGEAKEKFKQASQIPLDQQKTRQALDMMTECDYQKFVKQGRDAKAKGNTGEAKGYFGLAQKMKDTEEVRKELEDLGP